MGCHFIFSGQTVLFVKAAVECSRLCQGRREWEDLGLARFRPGDSGAPRALLAAVVAGVRHPLQITRYS